MKTALGLLIPELSESEDERIRKELIEFIEWSVDRHFMREDFHQAKRPSEWIAYLEKQKEPNPAEWSEEDEKIRNLAIEWAETMYGQFRFVDMGSTDFRKIVAWLKSLRPQPKPEWSEEDKEKLKAICTYLRDYSRLAKLGEKLRFNEYCDFLESLRPQSHWKPSDEQIQALEYVVSSIPPNYLNEQEYMMTLIGQVIQQLKKL